MAVRRLSLLRGGEISAVTDWILPLLCGFGAGVISAWGVGGGTLLLLVMTLFLGVEQRTAQGINLLFFLPTAASALLCHWRSGYLDKPTLRAAVPPAVLAAAAGAWLATALDVELLRRPFGVYLLLSGVSLLLPKQKTQGQ
ncbi:MAG: sulfite exporter TauE/SafE family protein [Ruminococcaceae bacterium]|nr:sulfite exporter TauE/SafE family protein [Oscillospiraceae bacterium]